MAELQEVQITEEKPLLPGQTPEAAKTHSVETPYGSVTFTVYGTPKPKRPAILTYHDVGLNYKSCFQPLFQFEDMQEIIQNFVRVHVDAPGMEEGAPVFPLGYQYPSLDQLADMIPCVLQYLNFSTIIGVGVGAGAYILARYALTGLTSSIPEMILGHLFSQEELSGNSELIQKYRNIITHAPNLDNIELYWNSYNNRRDLNFERGGDITLKCPVMLVVGDQAPHEDAVVECNSKLDPTQTSFLKMADSGGQPQLTQPGKLTEAFKYFLQGMGYMASSCMTRLSRSRTASLTSAASVDGNRSRSRTLSQSSESGTLSSGPPGHTMEVSC
ncbi:NDRG2 isoform 18 [Pan troglodytes]|uniref:NDRG family member 2 n=6 Tax=Hominoidea TaxID=314295 RepID=A0A2J8TSS4_PONAB|nr:NDRG2 isoform 18 [Pan troglodytes]PNJ36077.1 NDRG2 isoform 62 [Pongo abelii]